MIFKLSQIFLPNLISFFVLACLLKLEDLYHNYIYKSDPSFDLGPQIDIPIYIILFVPFVFAILFQVVVIIPFWNNITKHKLLFRPKLWQNILFVSLFITSVLGLISSTKDGSDKESFKFYLIMTAIFIIYWVVNFLTLGLIERTKNRK